MRLGATMETMHAAGRRRLPPVPRLNSEQAAALLLPPRRTRIAPPLPAEVDVATERFVLGPPTGEQPTARPVARRGLRQSPPVELDAAQQFVAQLRGAAADFAAAAGATSAVVREAVPPARHRRSRCRLVLRYSDGTEADLMFLGPAGPPAGIPARHGFDRQIRRWLAAGQPREEAWLVADPDAPGGLAVDLTAWVAAG
jgi:hypothetical protein